MVSDLSSIVAFVRPHIGADPGRYVRLRAGRARRTADTIWRRDLSADEQPVTIAQLVVERHSGLSGRDKGWLEVCEKGPRAPIIDTLPLGEPSEVSQDDTDADELSRGELVTALVQSVLGATRQLSEENASLRAANATKDDQIIGMVHKHTEIAMQAAKDGVLLTMHENGFFAKQEESVIDRVQALIPLIEKVSPHVAAAYASAQAARARAAPVSAADVGTAAPTTEERVEQSLADFEAIAGDPILRDAIVQPVRLARLRAAAMAIMAAAAAAGTA